VLAISELLRLTRTEVCGLAANIAAALPTFREGSPPYPRGRQHSVGLGSMTYTHTKLLTATVRLFGDSGAGDKGMPFYTVIHGSEGRHHVFAKPRTPRLPKTLSL
jgi:hypothetical protein